MKTTPVFVAIFCLMTSACGQRSSLPAQMPVEDGGGPTGTDAGPGGGGRSGGGGAGGTIGAGGAGTAGAGGAGAAGAGGADSGGRGGRQGGAGGTRPAPDGGVTDAVSPVGDADPANVLRRLRTIPGSVELGLGQTASVRAQGIFANGRSRDVSLEATWSSANPAIATVSTTARAAQVYGVALGTTALTVSFADMSAQVSVNVIMPTLEGLGIQPERPGAGVGGSVELHAEAYYRAGLPMDVTAQARWSSSDPAIASVAAGGRATCAKAGIVTVAAAFGDFSGETLLVCSLARKVVGLALQPSTFTLAVGEGSGFATLALFSDGTAEDVTEQATLASADRRVAEGNGAQVQAVAIGTAGVTATYMGFTASGTVKVVSDLPVSLELQPPTTVLGPKDTADLSLQAIFRDGRADSVTADSWTSSAPAVASVDTNGTVTGHAEGKATITASYMGKKATAVITVGPIKVVGLRVTPLGPHLHVDGHLRLVAAAVFSDGSSAEVSDQVVWMSSNPRIAVVQTQDSILIGISAGTATVTAYYPGVQDSVTVTVEPGRATHLSVSPPAVVLSLDDGLTLQAILAFDDGSSQDVTSDAQWRSNNAGTIAVDTGTLSLNQAGTATIIASYSGFSASSQVTVSAARLQSVTVTPASVAVPVGQVAQLTATAEFEDGTTRDISARATWASSNPNVAVVGSGGPGAGVVTAVAAGTATITATSRGQHASATVTVP